MQSPPLRKATVNHRFKAIEYMQISYALSLIQVPSFGSLQCILLRTNSWQNGNETHQSCIKAIFKVFQVENGALPCHSIDDEQNSPGIDDAHDCMDGYESINIRARSKCSTKLNSLTFSILEGKCLNQFVRIKPFSYFKSLYEMKQIIKMNHTTTIHITGGFGMMGKLITAWKYRTEQVHLNIVGRSGKNKEMQNFHGKSDSSAIISCMMNRGRADLPHSNYMHVIHASGAIRDAMIDKQNVQSFNSIMNSKVYLFYPYINDDCRGVDRFTLCSSIVSLLGSSGQSNYAAANSWLDTYSNYRSYLGINTISIQWGAWCCQQSMATFKVCARMIRLGLGVISSKVGLIALNKVLSTTTFPVVTISPFSTDKIRNTYKRHTCTGGNFHSTIFTELINCKKQEIFAEDEGRVTKSIFSISVTDHTDIFSQLVALFDSQLGFVPSADQSLIENGVDSLAAVEISNLIGAEFGVTLPGTLIFDFPTIKTLTKYLHDISTHDAEMTTSYEKNYIDSSYTSSSHSLFSFVKFSKKFPGSKMSDGVARAPYRCWDTFSNVPMNEGALKAVWGAFLHYHVDHFDNSFFQIPVIELNFMDNQQRLLLFDVAECIPHPIQSVLMQNTDIGVFVGHLKL